jgi:hypothetical protein
MEVSNEQRSSDTLRLISFSCSHREVRWARMRLVKDWGCMISGTEYGTYRGPAHSVVRAYTMGSTGLRPLWSSCKSRVMQLQLLALPSNPVEGSVSFWAHNWTPLCILVYGIWDEHEPRSVRDHFPLFAPSITFFSSPLRMYDVSASTHSKMHVLFVQSAQCLNQLTAPAVSRRKPTRICSSASIPWCGCPLMEFLCVGIIWASSSGRNSHTFLQRL